jgi:UDP-glucuronate decarboxylase
MPGFEDVGKVINCELAEQNFALVGSKSEVVARPLPKDDPRQRQPDIARAEKLSCWRPTVERDEGLRSTIAYFETLLREHGKSLADGMKLQRSAAR